jgi:succinate dehydrogenase / fumarate reductase iron-sulfur subunit
MLFVAANPAHLNLPLRSPERATCSAWCTPWTKALVTNQLECEAVCPKTISTDFIALLNREYGRAVFRDALCRI